MLTRLIIGLAGVAACYVIIYLVLLRYSRRPPAPIIDFTVARSTETYGLGLYVQQCGRASRKSGETGKAFSPQPPVPNTSTADGAPDPESDSF
jgi:hypothetical protein